MNGLCEQGQCHCTNEWEGERCDTRKYNYSVCNACIIFVTSSHSATCRPSCNHGECIAPNHCTCNGGWEGLACNTSKRCLMGHFKKTYILSSLMSCSGTCTPPCENGGTCYNGTCNCLYNQYNGSSCEQGQICSLSVEVYSKVE